MIHWLLCKKLNFDQTSKWYMHNSQSVQENETDKVLLDFEMQTVGSPNPDQTTIPYTTKKKKTCRIVDFAVPADQSKMERMRKEG